MKQRPIITITTDFGDDFALAQLKAILFALNTEIIPVTISNQITKFSVVEGSFILANAYSLFPPGTIHIGVVDPGVGTNREGIIIQTNKYTFIGPNNGLFAPSVKDYSYKIHKIEGGLVNNSHSNTFHGRDIFAKVAGLLTLKPNPLLYSTPLDKSRLFGLDFQPNQILHIDPYGNIKINNSGSDFKVGDKIILKTSKKTLKLPFVKTFADVAPGHFLAYKGSHNILEIAKNLDSANEQLKFKVGDILNIQKVIN